MLQIYEFSDYPPNILSINFMKNKKKATFAAFFAL